MVKGVFGGESPAFADVEVLWIGKGSANAPRVRIWDLMTGTDCGTALHMTSVGEHVVFALVPAPTSRGGIRVIMKPGTQEGYELVRVPTSSPLSAEALKVVPQGPIDSDYDVGHGCGEPLLVLKTPAEIAQYVGKKIP